jgi:hypothetical protein
MPTQAPPDENPILAAMQTELRHASKNPFLVKLFLEHWQRVMKRLTYFYAQLSALPRRSRRALQRAAATSLIGIALLLALSSAPVVQAATIQVDPGAAGINPGDGCSLVEAIHNANDGAATYAECVAGSPSGGNTITFQVGGNTLNYTTKYGTLAMLPEITSQITIEASGTTIQRDLSAPAYSVIAIDHGDLTLNNAVITGGVGKSPGPVGTFGYGGGGILNAYGTLTLNDSTITGNAAYAGGGISNVFAQATINRSTISYNYAFVGGGISDFYSTVTLNADKVIKNNYAPHSPIEVAGGGIFNAFGTSQVNASMVSGNFAYSGGGIFNFYAEGSGYLSKTGVSQSTISGNTAGNGGGILNGGNGSIVVGAPIHQGAGSNKKPHNAQVLQSFLAKGQAEGGAAAITQKLRLKLGAKALKRSKVSGNVPRRHTRGQSRGKTHPAKAQPKQNSVHPNRAKGFDGSAANLVYINQSTIANNTAYYSGGGIENFYNYSTTVLVNSTVTGNAAQGDCTCGESFGGGIDNYAGVVALVNSTVSGNTASGTGNGGFGGGIMNEYYYVSQNNTISAYLYMSRSLISGNSATAEGDEINNALSNYLANDYNLFGHSGETNAEAFAYSFTPGINDYNATSDGDGTSHSVPTALASILNTTPGNNGGPTQTLALVANSPAIDKAPSADCDDVPTNGVDQRGAPRNFDGDSSPSANECDIGAYEFGAPTATTVTGLRAQAVTGKELIKWRTTTEAKIAGFNIWRAAGKGTFKQINAKFKRAKHAGDAAGAKYQFGDKKTKHGQTYRYKIEIKYLDGHSEWTNVIKITP